MEVDERVEYVMPDDICLRCNEKQQKRRRGGQSVQLPDWVMNHLKAKYFCSYLGDQNEITFVGGISENVRKVSLLFLLGSLVFAGLYLLE